MALSPYYASHEWPAHVHREYPKWVGDRIVGNAEEEAAAIADQPAHAPPPALANANDVADLKAQVAALTALLTARTAAPEPTLASGDVVPTATDAPPLDARVPLWAECEARGIFFDRRWNLDRLRKAMADADAANA